MLTIVNTMGEEFQGGVCGGDWWNLSRGGFGSSPCSSVLGDIGSVGWSAELAEMKARASEEYPFNFMLFQDTARPLNNNSFPGIDPPSAMMTTDCNPLLTRGSRRFEESYVATGTDAMNTVFPIEHQSLDQIAVSGDHVPPSQGLAPSVSVGSNLHNYPSSLLETLLSTGSSPRQSVFDKGSSNYPTEMDGYSTNLSDFSSFLKPKQQASDCLPLSDNTHFWSSPAPNVNDISAGFLNPAQSDFLLETFEEKSIFSSINRRPNSEEILDSDFAAKKSSEPVFKRPRFETPSPMPTFKVRKEKLGDRITALQQLVSPFGKTDTASVLHEAIGYIKLLHDQVNVLSTPYLKNGAQRQQVPKRKREEGGAKQDLRSRGLCLVPVSSTFPVTAAATATEFWTPTIGGPFR